MVGAGNGAFVPMEAVDAGPLVTEAVVAVAVPVLASTVVLVASPEAVEPVTTFEADLSSAPCDDLTPPMPAPIPTPATPAPRAASPALVSVPITVDPLECALMASVAAVPVDPARLDFTDSGVDISKLLHTHLPAGLTRRSADVGSAVRGCNDRASRDVIAVCWYLSDRLSRGRRC